MDKRRWWQRELIKNLNWSWQYVLDILVPHKILSLSYLSFLMIWSLICHHSFTHFTIRFLQTKVLMADYSGNNKNQERKVFVTRNFQVVSTMSVIRSNDLIAQKWLNVIKIDAFRCFDAPRTCWISVIPLYGKFKGKWISKFLHCIYFKIWHESFNFSIRI